jgi:hypothetical protein
LFIGSYDDVSRRLLYVERLAATATVLGVFAKQKPEGSGLVEEIDRRRKSVQRWEAVR